MATLMQVACQEADNTWKVPARGTAWGASALCYSTNSGVVGEEAVSNRLPATGQLWPGINALESSLFEKEEGICLGWSRCTFLSSSYN